MRVVYFIVVNATHRYFNGSRSNVVDKRPVVRNYDHCFGAIDQKIFEPLDGLDIHVIGRLIQ